MNEYMVEIGLPAEFTTEFVSLIPKQRRFVNRMFEQGKMTSFTLAGDRSKAWTTLVGPNEKEILEVIAQMPLIHFFQVDVRRVSFSMKQANMLPQVSLN